MNPHGGMTPKPHVPIPITADNFWIYLALAAACVAGIAYLVTAFTKGRDPRTSAIGRIAYYVSAASAGAALAYLLQCILSGARYDIAYVSDNSSLADQLVYRVSSLWAGQGGSLLLWAVMGAIIGLFLLRKLEQSSPVLLAFWCSAQAFFLTLLVVDDPMKRLLDFQPGGMGGGMNPLLKNPWMVIHPPVVFLAYALLAVPAALAVQALIDGDATKWAKKCLPWAIGAWVAMTGGLVLGMIWSYEVLGWGGYWGWDPVENASLVPWLFITALVHGLVLQRQRGGMARWNVILAFAGFLSVLYATFLTRSGILSNVSVHAFGNSDKFWLMPIYPWLKWVPIAYSALCVSLLAARWKVMSSGERKPLSPTSRDLAISVGVTVLCLFAFVVLYGITFSTFKGQPDARHPSDLQPIFYTTMSVPLALAAILLIGLSPLLRWGGGESGKESGRLTNAVLALGAVLVVAVAAIGLCALSPGLSHRLLGWLQTGDRSSAAIGALLLLIGFSLVAAVTSVLAGVNSSLRRCGPHMAHAGVALVIIGIVFSTTGRSSVIDLTENGRSVRAQGYDFSYHGSTYGSDQKDTLHVTVERNGHSFEAPLSVATSERGVTMFPYIKTSPLSDLYISPDKLMSDTLTPELSWDGRSLIPHAAAIPGTSAALVLVGMQVESHAVVLQYIKPGQKPVEFHIGEGQTASVDGYTFTFKGFPKSGGNMMTSAKALVKVSGAGLNEMIVLRVSKKPLISLLWLGTILIMLGGCIALINRRSAKA